MIFGFNTDVKFENIVYHVQSEARVHELRLETQIFLRGRCIGKHATSYAEQIQDSGFSEERLHEMLKEQHKRLVAVVRDGRIEAEFGERPEPEPAEELGPEPVALAHLDDTAEPDTDALRESVAMETFVVEPEPEPAFLVSEPPMIEPEQALQPAIVASAPPVIEPEPVTEPVFVESAPPAIEPEQALDPTYVLPERPVVQPEPGLDPKLIESALAAMEPEPEPEIEPPPEDEVSTESPLRWPASRWTWD